MKGGLFLHTFILIEYTHSHETDILTCSSPLHSYVLCPSVHVFKGAGTPFSLMFVQFFSQKITGIVLSPHNYGYSTLTGIYLPTLGLI